MTPSLSLLRSTTGSLLNPYSNLVRHFSSSVKGANLAPWSPYFTDQLVTSSLGATVESRLTQRPGFNKSNFKESEDERPTTFSALASCSIDVTDLAPLTGAFNTAALRGGVLNSLRNLPKNLITSSYQRAAFVTGLKVADCSSRVIRKRFGCNATNEYAAAFAAGVVANALNPFVNTAKTCRKSVSMGLATLAVDYFQNNLRADDEKDD